MISRFFVREVNKPISPELYGNVFLSTTRILFSLLSIRTLLSVPRHYINFVGDSDCSSDLVDVFFRRREWGERERESVEFNIFRLVQPVTVLFDRTHTPSR